MKRLIPLLFFAVASTTFAAEPRPQRFWLGVVRTDGVLTPFAVYDNGKWLTPWPEYYPSEQSQNTIDPVWRKLPHFDSKVFPKTASLSQTPLEWLGGSSQLPDTWYLWKGVKKPQPLRITSLVQYGTHCLVNWGLAIDNYKKQIVNYAPQPKAGIASSEEITENPMVMLEKGSTEVTRMTPVLLGKLDQLEEQAISKLKRENNWDGEVLPYTLHPSSRTVRNRARTTHLEIYKSSRPVGNAYVYYTQLSRTYKKPEGSPDVDCGAQTVLQAFLQKRGEQYSTLKADVTITDCDGKELSIITPRALITTKTGSYLISESYGYEWENYLVDAIGENKVQNVVNRSGGGC